MEKRAVEEMIQKMPLLQKMQRGEEVAWVNPDKTTFENAMKGSELTMADVDDAEARLARFAPFIMKLSLIHIFVSFGFGAVLLAGIITLAVFGL